MKNHLIFPSTLILLIIFTIFLPKIPKIESALKCPPDFKSKGDNYSSIDDPQDNFEYFYGYEFAHKVGDEYYDHWKGVYWDNKQFCYDAYDNFTRPDTLTEPYDEISEFQIVSNLDDVVNPDSYILIEHDQSNLINFHKKMCMTKTHNISNYNHGEHELLIKMDTTLEKDFLGTPHHFYFTIENPSNDTITFSFKSRNFVNTTEYMNTTIYEWGPNSSQCVEEVITDAPTEEDTQEETTKDEDDDNQDNTSSDSQDSDISEDNGDLTTDTVVNTVKQTEEPCERDIIIVNETFLNWTEEYPIPEVFYFTNNYTIEPHQSIIMNISLTFEKNDNDTEGGFFIISEETGKSEEPFYWPDILDENGKIEKLTNLEIILESNFPLGVSSFSLMRRRETEESSYLGKECNMKYEYDILNGRCGDGFHCNSNINGTGCVPCEKRQCKQCDLDNKCTECYLISVDGQWNPPGGKGNDLACDLDYIDITKIIINDKRKDKIQHRIEVPPAIHWRVTMDFWVWISDTSVLSDAEINLNIVYKDFIALTLRCFPEGLRVFATPIEWLYEYPTYDPDFKYDSYYDDNIEPYKRYDIYKFLKEIVGSYGKVTKEDLIKNATSNWVYIRYAFNLDSSKHYLNNLPESNLQVAQIYTEQSGMPFHMKKFYELDTMTYLYFHNFYFPLKDEQYENNLNATIYLRNLNIFREYIPQNIITKYYNLHVIDDPTKFPQILASFPFSNIIYEDSDRYKMKGYNYYVRRTDGKVESNLRQVTEYYLTIDPDKKISTLRPPRNFWRLNFLELNKQPETCDFESMTNIKCDSPSEYCFDENKAFICEKNNDENNPYYLDIKNLECKTHCDIGYMHPPRYMNDLHRLYCSHFCDSGNKQCPSDNYKYTDIYSNFLCSNEFFNLYYKCFNQKESLNNADFSGIFFSDELRTPTIYIELPSPGYTQFAIDFWYFPDDRLRNIRYKDQKNNTELKVATSHTEPATEKERTLFLSDCCKIKYGADTGGVIGFFKDGAGSLSQPGEQIDSRPVDSNWNHVVVTYFKGDETGTTFYITLTNKHYHDCGEYSNIRINYSKWKGAPSNVKLSKIIFCSKDPNVNDPLFGAQCKTTQWLDGFYRRLQIFDLKYSAKLPVFSSHQYEDDGLNGMLKHRYIYGLNSIVDNHLLDSIGNAHGYLPIEYNSNAAMQNPDKTNYILYEVNFAPQGGISNWGGMQFVNGYTYTRPELQIKNRGSCTDKNCLICQPNKNCLACKKGFSLFSRECKGDVNNGNIQAPYFYKNPGKNMPERLSLNLDFDKIINEPYFTFFFFIKIYGFIKDAPEEGPVKLIIFHQEKKDNGEYEDVFYLAWDPRTGGTQKEKLFFYVNGCEMFELEYFREYYFGLWIPISFTAFREEDRRFKMNMAQASILYFNLPRKNWTPGDTFPYIKFTQFTITNKWVGLLSEVKIFNKFIVNAWGILKHQHESPDTVNDDTPDSAIQEINLKSDSPDSCLKASEILNQPASGYKAECVNDYNPHLYRGCSTMEAQTVRYHQGDGYNGLCNACCNSWTSPSRCLGGKEYCNLGNDDDTHSCENQTPIWKTYYLTFNGSGQTICYHIWYIDYNRYKYATATNIESPQDVWAIDFWFKTSTNQAVKERNLNHNFGDNAKNRTSNNNNFNEFEIDWNYHIKLRVYKKTLSEIDSSFTYIVECTPLVVLEHQDLTSTETIENDIGDAHYSWRYVACGVNFQEKLFYLTNNNRFGKETTFTSKLELIPSAKTTLSITEKSRTGYGFTFIYQLRLWHCYNCAHAFRNLDYQKNDKNFNAVYHNFDGTGSSSSAGQTFGDQAGNAKNGVMYQAADFPGYTYNYSPGGPVLCDETIYQYYNEEHNACERHYNLARTPHDYSINIPSSRNARYTMEFWFFVENSAELSPGFNLLWDYHLSITLLRDTSNKNTINAICFPQSYRDNVDQIGGQDIIDLYDKALNKDKYAFYQGSSIWNFVRCAVDQTRKLYYINDNLELKLEGEILYGTERNYRPFRFFKINAEHELKFQNAFYNPTRIFVRNIKCYRDFIDFRLMDLKYKVCGINSKIYGNWDDCQFYPLAFCFDYGEYVNPSWPCFNARSCFSGTRCTDCGLVYHKFPETSDNTLSKSWEHWKYLLLEDVDQYYPTFPDIYLPNFCLHGYSGGDKEYCTGSNYQCRLSNSTAYFWPPSGNYLDLDKLTFVGTCEELEACRPPDGWYNRNYCLIKKNTNNMINCEWKSIKNDYYYDSYECKTGYVRVYYECIEPEKVPKSAMYFSNVYSFPNVVFDPSDKARENADYVDWKDETRLASYYIEVWIKFDALNYRNEITEIEHYLYAHPHQIIKDPIDQKYKYSNKLISQGSYYYTLTSMNNYEWNKIIIENSYDVETKKFEIKFYLNYEFENPEFTIPDLDSEIYKLHFRGFGFCDKTDSYCRVNKDVVYLHWGVAWYRNFRVWDADITSLQTIQACEYGYTELINAQKYYFSLTVDSIKKNTIVDRIDPDKNKMELNYWVYYTGNEFKEAFDNAMRENYSTDNFDKTYVYENNYISGINEDGTDYLISSCAAECKRCYSSANTDCYECRTGYSIYGKQCKVRTGYFLKTPPENENVEEIIIKTKVDGSDATTDFNLETKNPITITLYIKFFGIELNKVKQNPTRIYWVLVCFYKDASNNCKTYIGYNYNDKTIVFVVNGVEIYSSRAKNYVGVWTHFGISLHRRTVETDYFPHMLNFMIDQQELIPVTNFDPTEEEVMLNTFSIRTEPIGYYSSFKVFSSFYYGPYGHVNAIGSTRGSKLVYQINLYGSSSINCLTDANIDMPTHNIKTLKPVCVPDYLPYEDSNNICSDDNHFMDVIYKVSPPCELCDSQCITNCYSLESSTCTCDYYEGLYWVRTNDDYQEYECQKIDSINFAFYEQVEITGITIVKTDEISMVFWLDIYEYRDNNFDSFEILWDRYMAVTITGNGQQDDNKFLKVVCHADYDFDNPDMEHTTITDEGNLMFNRWNYIRCQVDKFRNYTRVNDYEEHNYQPVNYPEKDFKTSTLIIRDNTLNFNYGFSFVRELKLFSSYNFDFWDESHHNIKHDNFGYLLHYFHNNFQETKLEDAKIVDEVEGNVFKLDQLVKPNRIGYNYVINYTYLVICEEGYVYNEASDRCDIFDSTECIVPRTGDDKCLRCASSKPYLKDDDICYDDCSPNYYADDYFKQCKKCEATCHTCFGKYYFNCLSCVDPFYYIESLHRCVENCQEFGLVISNKTKNTCEELITASAISVPVYLNHTYDYNPNNDDFVSKIVNRDKFEKIIGHLTKVSNIVETLWKYNLSETIEINKGYRYYKESDIPDEDPITSTPSELTIQVDNNYFKYGYKYVFDLEIYSQNGFFSTSHTHRYILMMNDYPVVGDINILPAEGYITNTFLITINKCTDDVSKKNLLKYKFSYFKKKSDIIFGYKDQGEEEIVIQNWSKYSEALFEFPELNPTENYTYYIRGYCMDEYDLFYSEIKYVRVIDIPTNSGEDIALKDAINKIDLNEELEDDQLLKRAEFISTTTVDFQKEEELLNRTNITTFNKKGVWQENLILYDPVSSSRDIYCNYRGNSYVEYFYLICDCNGYVGGMCQIDHSSYDFAVENYNLLFTKVKMQQTGKYNHNLIKSVNLIMKSGAAFMEIEQMDFMLDSIEFINLYRNKFAEQMMDNKNYETYFDIYNSLIEYGLSIVNKLKYKNFITKHSKNSQGLYNEEQFRNATLAKGEPKIVQDYFNKIKVSLQNLLEFYASNKKELRFINKNINVYVALIDQNFEFDTFFNEEKSKYQPYMSFQKCIEKTMIQSQGNPSYRVYLSAIVWKVSPFMSSEELYWNTSSPIISFKFLDYDTGEKIYLSDCGNADNQIQLYFPVNNYNLVDKINQKRSLLSPENQYALNDDIFCDPVYINASGAVFNSTPEERRSKYFLGFNFSCEYYKVPSEDQNNIKLTKETLDYHKYTKENYIQCLTNKLVQEAYGEFVVNSYQIPAEFHINSRFFYLKHFALLSWSDNYTDNQAFYFFVVVGITYAGLSLAYIYFEKYNFVSKQRMNELKKEITKMNLPYREDYIFNNDLKMGEEVKGKLKDKRKPNNEEMNLDTNNVDIDIMADEISKYNKGFKSKENALGFTPEYFGIKTKKIVPINSRYFPGEVDVRKRPDNDDEISPEKLDKLKKFYHVGFKGLNPNENIKKEMQISKDKKRILVKKQENLGKIEELDEDDANDIDIARNDFFDDNEDDEDIKEKETTIKGKTRNFKDNMNKYRDFVSTSDHVDTESNLKSSKRETATKKFFGSNPPKKGLDRKINTLVFTEKDQQKIGKMNSAFFGQDKLDSAFKNKRKQKNIFQNDYDDLYKPGFKGPKVVSENLGFYSTETLDFEQDMDNDNNRPPYFGSKFRKMRKRDEEDKTQGTNAGIRTGFYYKNPQIDLKDDEEDMPPLAKKLTFLQKMEEFHDYSISFKGFLIKNIKSRYILLTTFDRMSIVYDKYMRAGNFAAQLAMFAFFLSIFFTNDENQVLYESKDKSQISSFIIYCLVSEIFGCIVVHLPAYCFWVNDKKFRQLYNTVRLDGGINVLKQTEDIIKKGRLFWIILGVIIQLIYLIMGFYFAFGFCATYYYQRTTYFFALICTIGFDFIVAEFVWEIIIGLLFYIRDCGRIIVFFGTLFNTLRNIKHLV